MRPLSSLAHLHTDFCHLTPDGDPTANAPTEGLAAYAQAPVPAHLLSASPAPLINTDAALIETATGLVKQLQTHSLPLVKEWLKFISKVCGSLMAPYICPCAREFVLRATSLFSRVAQGNLNQIVHCPLRPGLMAPCNVSNVLQKGDIKRACAAGE